MDAELGLRLHLFTAYTTKQPELRDGQAGSMWVSLGVGKLTSLQWQRRAPSFDRVTAELRRARLDSPEAVRTFSPPPSAAAGAQPQA